MAASRKRCFDASFGLTCAALFFACGARSGLEPGKVELGGAGSTAAAGTGGARPVGAAGAPTNAAGKPNTGAAPGGGSSGAATAGNATSGNGTGGSSSEAGASGDANAAGAAGAACIATGPELCNGVDDDCDGEIDEDLPLALMSDPVAVRVDEGTTQPSQPISCSSCAWAWYPQLIAPDDQLEVVWYLGLFGGYEKPSAFGRQLSWDLEAQDAVTSLGPQYWMSTLLSGATTPRGTLLTFVQRTGNFDFASFAYVNGALQTSDAVHLGGCGGAPWNFSIAPILPQVVTCASTSELKLFTVAENGSEVSAQRSFSIQEPNASAMSMGATPAGALRGERGLVVAPVGIGIGPTASSKLWSREIAADGTPLGDPLWQTLDVPRLLTVEQLFATPTGYLLFGDDRQYGPWPSGRFVAPLAPDGKLSGAIVHSDVGILQSFDDVVVTRLGAGFAIAERTDSGLVVEQLDADGNMTARLVQLVSPYSRPSLMFAHGKLYVAFVEEPPPGPNRVLVSSFSCDPAATAP